MPRLIVAFVNERAGLAVDVRGILFDKDGTLFDFQSTWSSWAEKVIAAHGRADPDREALIAEAIGFDVVARAFLPESIVIASPFDVTAHAVHTVVGGDRDLLLSDLDALARSTPQAEVAGLQATLAHLAKDYALGVATNDSEGSTMTHLRDAGVVGHFSFIAGSDSGYGSKPAPGQLLGFAEATGLPPESILMVGDSTHDLEAASAAGMRRVAVLTGVASSDDLRPHSDVVLPDITHLARWIAQTASP